MLGSHPISAVIGADITATSDTASFSAYVKALSDAGLHVMMCQRESKIPADYRTPKQKKDDLTEYAEATGDTTRDEPRGGVHMATNNVSRLRSYVKRYRKEHGEEAPVNLAIEVGNSALIIVDCDTAAERAAFCDWWASKHGDERLRQALPTVLSPGVFKDGVWVHKDGGHFYFTVDGLNLPANMGKMSVTHNGVTFDVFWRDRYVLIPPSVRAEGPYQRVGPVLQLTDHEWLHREILTYAASRSIRPEGGGKLSEHNQDALVAWYTSTSWGDILAPHGWEWTGEDKSCGCPIWGRPGGRSSDKSATAHEPGCSNSRYNPEDPPIHFWTSQPGKEIQEKLQEVGGGASTLSKLQLFAALEFEGSDRAALRSMPGMQSMNMRSQSVQVPGMPFFTTVRVEVEDDDEDVIVTDSYSYEDDVDEASIEVVPPPHAATDIVTNPFTKALSQGEDHPHVHMDENSGGVLQKTLAQPATLDSSENSRNVSENLTPTVTPIITPPVTLGVTFMVTPGVTEIESVHYGSRYESPLAEGGNADSGNGVSVEGRHLSLVDSSPENTPTQTPVRHSVIPRHRRPRGAARQAPTETPNMAPALEARTPEPATRISPPSIDGNPFSVLSGSTAASVEEISSTPSFGGATSPTAAQVPQPSAALPVAPATSAPRLSDEDVSRIATMVANILAGNTPAQ